MQQGHQGLVQHRNLEFDVKDDGLYVFNQKSQSSLYLCRYLDVKRVLTNILTGDVEIEIEYLHNERLKTMTFPRETLVKNKLLNVLPAKGIDVTDLNVMTVLEYLLFREETAEHVYFHNKVGWNNVDNERVFLHHQVVGSELESEYVGDLNIMPKGTLEDWKKTIEDEVLGNSALELALTLGLSSPVASLFRKLIGSDVLFFHIYGHSTTGKTTCMILATSPFGLPSKNNNGLIKTWLATNNAILGSLNGLHGLPMAIDEASVKTSQDYANMIYQLTDGIEKGRLDKNANAKPRGEWSGTILSTGENSLLTSSKQNNGLRVRLLELGQIPWTASAENAEHLKTALNENYGHAGVMFIQGLLRYSDEALIEGFRKCKLIVKDRMLHTDNFSDRISDKIAVVYLTAKIAKGTLNLNLNPEKILDILLDADANNVQDRDMGLKAYEFINSEITRNVNKFVHKNSLSTFDPNQGGYGSKEVPTGEIIGRLVMDGNKYTEALILKVQLEKMLNEGGFTDIDLILSQWRDQNLISVDKGKYTKKRKILDNGNPQRVIVINLSDDIPNDQNPTRDANNEEC